MATTAPVILRRSQAAVPPALPAERTAPGQTVAAMRLVGAGCSPHSGLVLPADPPAWDRSAGTSRRQEPRGAPARPKSAPQYARVSGTAQRKPGSRRGAEPGSGLGGTARGFEWGTGAAAERTSLPGRKRQRWPQERPQPRAGRGSADSVANAMFDGEARPWLGPAAWPFAKPCARRFSGSGLTRADAEPASGRTGREEGVSGADRSGRFPPSPAPSDRRAPTAVGGGRAVRTRSGPGRGRDRRQYGFTPCRMGGVAPLRQGAGPQCRIPRARKAAGAVPALRCAHLVGWRCRRAAGPRTLPL